MLFVDVILPLPLSRTYTYKVPDYFTDLQQGIRVIVQFGHKKLYTALVVKVHQNEPKKHKSKPILSVLDNFPVVTEKQLDFWKWISSYYCCNIGDVMAAAFPSGLKLSSETIFLLGNVNIKFNLLNNREQAIIKALEKYKRLSLLDVAEILDQKAFFLTIKNLIDKKYIFLKEELNDNYKPKIIRVVDVSLDYESKIKNLEKSPKQLELLFFLLRLKNKNPKQLISTAYLVKSAQSSYHTLNVLVKKNLVIIKEEKIGRLKSYENKTEPIKELSSFQLRAYNEIDTYFKQKDVVLLHGVTSSGKTEIYVKLIQEAISRGEKVLYLLPEISLTTQIINRLRKYFGDKIAVYHSKFNQNERVEVWNEILQENRFSIVLGARSALFLPIKKLGLIIIDEEHENTFKQYNPAPRYNARDAAIVWAKMHSAKVLLGSATPSLETYTNAINKKYGLVKLSHRFGGVEMPDIKIVDIKYVRHRKQMKGIFSPYMLGQIKESLFNKEQIILFQNRRGFAPVSECQSCGWTSKCMSCDVSLTYHKKIDLLKCHYCGYSEKPIRKCKSCGGIDLLVKGIGTEKIEEELYPFFPNSVIKRMDLDTTSKRYAHQEIISDFENKRIDILIGTQMVTKGLDFDNVGIVGVLNADTMLNFPDFRSQERAFQLMTQVSGRSGRKNKRGKVIIQTYSPDHAIISSVKENDYEGMFNKEMSERKLFNYPPYCKLIRLTVIHKDYLLTNKAARDLAFLMRQYFGKNVLGPEYPSVSRIKNRYLKNILLKIELNISLKQAKKNLLFMSSQINLKKEYKSVRFLIDVDPV